MIDWLTARYLELILNYKIMLGNPTHCSTVEALRILAFTLLVVFTVRLALHVLVFYGLRRRFPEYGEDSHPRLWRIYHRIAAEMNLKRVPALRRFIDRRPLVFTIGSLRPCIFIAPTLVERLCEDELKAVLVHELTHVKRRDGHLLWLLELLFLSLPLLFIQVFALSFIYSVQGSVYALLGSLIAVFVFRAVIMRWAVYLRELSCDDLSVDVIRDPLLLASSLISVCRIGGGYPKHRWTHALALTKGFATPKAGVARRVRRLADYRRPRVKFILGKALRLAAAVAVVVSIGFVLRVHAIHDDLDDELSKRSPGVIRVETCEMGQS